MDDGHPVIVIIEGNKNMQLSLPPSAEHLAFTELLDALNQVFRNLGIHTEKKAVGVEYMDSDGDRITVKSDEELGLMRNNLSNEYHCGRIPRIYPVTMNQRNIHHLVVETQANARPPSDDIMDEGGAAAPTFTSSSSPMHFASSPLLSSQRQHYGKGLNEMLLQRGLMLSKEKLQLVHVLGSGNTATVYRARHLDTGADNSLELAIKVIVLDVSEEAQQQIIHELEILHQCISDTIIHFYGAFYHESSFYLCTEYMDGGSLDRYGWVNALPVLGQVALAVVKGLCYLWERKIMHRDVKPSNILLNTRGYVKLCDFGVSIQLVNSIAKSYIGSNAYMAPERIQGNEYGIYSDIWSLGITITEVAQGKFPYTASKISDLLQCIVHDEAPQLRSDLFPNSLINFCSICLKKVPDERPKPEDLMKHHYIEEQMRVIDGRNLVSEWVIKKLETSGIG